MKRDFQWDFAGTRAQSDPWADGMLWPSSRFAGSDGWALVTGMGRWENEQQDILGGAQAKKIIGTTKDGAGAPLGSVTVQGFVTATDAYVGQVVSDTGGYYELCTWNTGQHYLVAYKNGSPDVAGTTVNTLTPV